MIIVVILLFVQIFILNDTLLKKDDTIEMLNRALLKMERPEASAIINPTVRERDEERDAKLRHEMAKLYQV